VSSSGKILDPFSDVVTHLTYFFCFTEAKIIPGWMFMLFVFRELGIILIRMVLISEGIALAASAGGKIKSLTFAFGSAVALLALGNFYFGIAPASQGIIILVCQVLVGIGLVLSWLSFADYLNKFIRRSLK
jgi:CDP-diacylglycerol--glycerol-3-phosphate 3-phosphatidyltransferase